MIKKLLLVATYLYAITLSYAGTLTKVPINTRNANPRGYVEYLPPNYDNTGSTKYPVLYWLHGLGEVGLGFSSSLDEVYNENICTWLKTHDVDFIVLIPQDFDGYWAGASGPTRIKAFVDWANEEYATVIDPLQQHMAGFSSGGYGVRSFIIENSSTYKAFATFTVMSSNLDLANAHVQRIVENNQYMWIHHGTNDQSPHKIETVMTFHNGVYNIDNARSRLTAYIGLGHNTWHEVYDGSGRQFPQLTGVGNGTTYYHWTSSDADVDWYGWMKSCSKSATKIATTLITLSNSVIEENNLPGAVIGEISANGSKPITFRLAAGSGNDNQFFMIEGSLLKAKSKLDYEFKSTYIVRIEAANAAGNFFKEFPITVLDMEDIITDIDFSEQRTSKEWRVYPNPFTNHISLSGKTDGIFIYAIEVFSIDGRALKTIPVNRHLYKDDPLTIGAGELALGTYFVKVRTDSDSQIIKLLKTSN